MKLCLWLPASSELTWWQQEKVGKGRGERCSHLWEHRLHLFHWGCLYVQSDTCLVLDWVCRTWVKWSNKNCTRMCAHVCFFKICFCHPRFLILAVEVALCGPVLCILWKAVMEEERMSIKSIARLFPCCCHYMLITSCVSFQLSER